MPVPEGPGGRPVPRAGTIGPAPVAGAMRATHARVRVAPPAGIEPATNRLEGGRSIR